MLAITQRQPVSHRGPTGITGACPGVTGRGASKVSGGEGGHVFCARTTDGGKTFRYLSPVTPIIEEPGRAIMPSSVRLTSTRLLTAVRVRGKRGLQAEFGDWVDLNATADNAATWPVPNCPAPPDCFLWV